MTTIAITRTRNGIPTSAEAGYITLTDQPGNVLVPEELVVPISEGYYVYQINTLGAGNYTVVWRFTNSGYDDDIITRTFTLDAAVAITDGVTLMRLEQLVARRVGPYFRFTAMLGSTLQKFVSTRIQSSVTLGMYEDQYLLRRGITESGALVPTYTPDDRVRLVMRYEPNLGELWNDRAWATNPDVNLKEMVEIMYLDPDLELRPNVQDALKRCFFWDTIQLQQAGAVSGGINLTPIAPWITQPHQVKQLSTSYAGAFHQIQSWRMYRRGKDLYIGLGSGASAGNLIIDALRPVHTLVNEETSLTGPNDDQDMIYVNPDYAAWAGVVELWKNQPERIQPLIKEGLRTDLKAAAAEYTKHGLIVANQFPDRIRVDFGGSGLAYAQIGNLPEPVA